LVFVTKYRRGVLDADMLASCKDAMRKVCGDFSAELREFNGEDDHVRLLVEYPPKIPVSGLVNSLKGVPPRRLRRSSPAGPTGTSCTGISGPVLLRRILRRCAAEHHPPVHRAAKHPAQAISGLAPP
jgi:REP element-mobilizing transposase RayT